jgi:hypothetical protein
MTIKGTKNEAKFQTEIKRGIDHYIEITGDRCLYHKISDESSNKKPYDFFKFNKLGAFAVELKSVKSKDTLNLAKIFDGREHQPIALRRSHYPDVYNYGAIVINHYYKPDRINDCYVIPINIYDNILKNYDTIKFSEIPKNFKALKTARNIPFSSRTEKVWNVISILNIIINSQYCQA